MIKSELIERLAQESRLSISDAKVVVDTIFDTIVALLIHLQIVIEEPKHFLMKQVFEFLSIHYLIVFQLFLYPLLFDAL